MRVDGKHCETLSQLKILIVEDKRDAGEILRHLLLEIGVRDVHEVSDGKAALGLLGQGFDCVLCDWNMPMMNGIELLKIMRGQGSVTPFIMLTGRGDQASVIEARKHGANGYLFKPYTTAQVEAKLRVILANAGRIDVSPV